MIKTSVESRRKRQNKQAEKIYNQELSEYYRLGFWDRLLSSKPKKPEEIDPRIKVGERFAIKYWQLCAPLHLEEVVSTPGSYIHLLEYGPIGIDSRFDDMWTIVEYQEDGTFIDLLTGESISKGLFVEDVYSSPGRASHLSERDIEQLYEVPFGIRSVNSRASIFGDVEIPLTEITSGINRLIEEETIPVIDEIMEAMGRQKTHNIEFINSWLKSYIESNKDIVGFILYNHPGRYQRQLDYVESLEEISESIFHTGMVKKNEK